MDTVKVRLEQLIGRYWRIPRAEGKALLHALRHSACSRVVVLRRHLAVLDVVVATAQGAREPDAQHLFREILSPPFVLALVNDLRATGALTAPQTRVIERAMLACVDRQGAWRPVEES